MTTRIREIPFNYSSFSDREIIIRYLGESGWNTLSELRGQRVTGRSARMLFEILGDLWVVDRNPFLEDDLLNSEERLDALVKAMIHRLNRIINRADGNQQAIQLADQCRQVVDRFAARFPETKKLRQKALQKLSHYTRADNIAFHGLARVAHVTDASDWRIEYPFVVITPDFPEELPNIVRGCRELDLVIIPRGGGTGYTGSAVPVHPNTAVINIEKLQHIGKIEKREQDNKQYGVIEVGAGVVTRRVAERAEAEGLVFAVDPTSIDASTIGGNIAMNAGGKKAVLWGCTVDNLLTYRMVMADSNIIEVVRLDHNLGKIHDVPESKFIIKHFAPDGVTTVKDDEELTIKAEQFRKPGLGKDVTNKALGGLPGIQKEGCDGIIYSAKFILHKMPSNMRTICLEFFGNDMRQTVNAITDIKDYLESNPKVALSGLEHLDERYLIAIKYATKAARRGERPRMVLLADVGGEDEKELDHASQHVIKMLRSNADGFIASSPEARKNFWKDRSRTAAIARHTNAFKLNEDVVIPLDRLGDYTSGIERINIEYSIKNKIQMIGEVEEYLKGPTIEARKQGEYQESSEDSTILEEKKVAGLELLSSVKNRWSNMLDSFDKNYGEVSELVGDKKPKKGNEAQKLIELLQTREIRISYRIDVERPLKALFIGGEYDDVRKKLDEIHAERRAARIFVALHMHAGDGNVHTNIPVNSYDYEMLHESEKIVDRIMAFTKELGGVISGEHGIGLTKIDYLDPKIIKEFEEYKAKVDPDDIFNRGKLRAHTDLERAYTPSLRLLEQEALILRETDFGELNDSIKHCLRCGKCKPVCNTHIPRANLDYSPRNKILATGLIMEAFLYEEQTRRGVSLRHFGELIDIADHCTICHKCYSPCPVNIDFGDVSILMRKMLRKMGKKSDSPGTWLAMKFLSLTDVSRLHLMRNIIFRPAIPIQRLTARFLSLFKPDMNKRIPAATTGKMELKTQLKNSIMRPIPAIPGQALRQILNLEDDRYIAIISNPEKVNDDSETVFYFPGCSAERLYSNIGMAVLSLLYETGARVVLPPRYLCCGYPQISSGQSDLGREITIQNRVLFHRIANTLNYLDIKSVLVSCGTCMDQLQNYEFSDIFPGSRLLDIHEFLLEKDVKLKGDSGDSYIYHDPCHTPIKTQSPLNVVRGVLNSEVAPSDRCCGEAGTMAVSRPDISTQVRFRKKEVIGENVAACQMNSKSKSKAKLVTTCPACLQGLGRFEIDSGVKVSFLAEELARQIYGKNWKQEFIKKIKKNGIEKALL